MDRAAAMDLWAGGPVSTGMQDPVPFARKCLGWGFTGPPTSSTATWTAGLRPPAHTVHSPYDWRSRRRETGERPR